MLAGTKKAAATRRLIAAAALRVAQDKGASAVTARDIAEASRVALRTVYNHYPTVAHAILGIDPDHPARLAERLLARPPEESAVEALAAAVIGRGVGPSEWRARAELAASDPGLYAAYVASFASIDARLTAAMARRLGVDPLVDLYPRLVVTASMSAFRAATVFAIETAPEGSSEDAVLDAILAKIHAAVATLRSGLVR